LQGGRCHFCSEDFSDNWVSLQGVVALVCDDCIHEITGKLPEVTRPKQFNHACEALGWYFSGIPRGQLVATSQQFLGHMRANVQAAVDRLLSVSLIRFFGIHEQQRYETLTFAALTGDARGAQMIAPAQYNEVDIGESAPIKCLNNSLWLCQTDALATRLSSPHIVSTATKPGLASRSPYPPVRWAGSRTTPLR
jgi:hypothetical protein